MSNPQATVIDIGEALTAKIQTVTGASAAVFDLVPDFGLAQVSDLKIIVTPQAYTRGNKGAASRETPDTTCKINIAIMKKCGSKADIPDLLELTENIAKAIERQIIGNGLVLSVEFDPIYSMDIFQQMKVFMSVCTANIKVIR